MCLFPEKNNYSNSIAYQKGIKEFECGYCPECLSKKSRYWALRCSFQAKKTPAIMITLTYDTYVYDENGNVIGEEVSDKKVDKRDCQLFLKRLREWNDRKGNKQKIKYLLTAEYGKRTGRAHYHAILFGVQFPDIVAYKKSKRGNLIYKSGTLAKLWGNGICTVDCLTASTSVARYCTKYACKDNGAADTFMLTSRDIGSLALLESFNGKSYYIDGNEYTIPKQIWNYYIMSKYGKYVDIDYKYVGKITQRYEEKEIENATSEYSYKRYTRAKRRRELFRFYRDNDYLYKRYLEYWKNKALEYERLRPDVKKRILQLPNDKYYSYKQFALKKYAEKIAGREIIPPRKEKNATYFRYLERFSAEMRACGLNLWLNDNGICPNPLVIKGQMTGNKKNNLLKTVRKRVINSFTGEVEYVYLYETPVKIKNNPFL